MRFERETFEDFHLHGASAPEWEQRYLQVSGGAMRSTLAEASSESVHVFRKWLSERVVQQGCLPAGQVCFALPLRSPAGMPRMQGREMADDALFVLRGGEEFTLQRPEGMELMAVTFAAEAFRELLDERPWPNDARLLLDRPAIRLGSGASVRLRRDLLSLLDVAAPGGVEAAPAGEAARQLHENLREAIVGATFARQGVGSASAASVVARCHRLVMDNAASPPGIEALCARLRISRRSLQNSFREVAGSTPVHYLRSLRLNAVRRRLMSTSAGELGVAQAATDHGFDHLGHFGTRYRELFGERPSDTPRRTG